MASFVVKHAVKHLSAAVGCSERSAEKLGNIAKVTTAIVAGDLVGLALDRAYTKFKDDRDYEPLRPQLPEPPENMHHYDSDDDDEDVVEVEGIDKHGHHKHLVKIQPYLNLAMEAYNNKPMHETFPFVKRSRLIENLKDPSKLRFGNFTTDTEVHVCVLDDGTLVFAFRGTELNIMDLKSLLKDILTDLSQSQVPLEHYNASQKVAYRACSSVKVHEGFMLAFQDVTKTARPKENLLLVAEGLGVKATEVKRVVCTGHSLGGALATLCAHWCRRVAFKNAKIWCVTIGSPRVGNIAFAKEFNETVCRSYRVVNKGDLVPSIPHLYTYCKLWAAYKHVKGLIYLSEHPRSKDTILLKRGGRRPTLIVLSFLDHRCLAYRNSINKLLTSLNLSPLLLAPALRFSSS